MKLRLLLLIFVLLNLVPLVSAQYYYDSSFSAFTFPFFDFTGGDLLEFYSSAHQFWDFLLALALLIAIFSHTIEDKLGKQTPVILAIILSIGFVSFERKFDFNLGDLGPIAILFFLLSLLIAVLYLIKWIWDKFSENRGSSILSAVLFAIALLVVAVLYLKDTGKMPDLGTGQKILGLGVLAALGYLLFLAYRAGWFSSSETPGRTGGVTIEEPDLSRARAARAAVEGSEQGTPSEKPSLFGRLFKESPDYKEYRKVSLLVSEFIRNTKDPEFKENFILKRYNATQNYIKSFIVRFPKSIYIKHTNELLAQLNKSFQDYTSFKQNKEQIEQNINYLDSLLNNEDEPVETLERAQQYISAFYSEHQKQIQSDKDLSKRLNSLIARLNQRIQKSRLSGRPISPEQLNKFRQVSPESLQQLKQEMSEEQLSQFQQEINLEEAKKFEPVEKRVRGFFSSCQDLLDRRLGKVDFDSLYKQTNVMLSKYVEIAQPTQYLERAKQYQEDVANAYKTTINDFINSQNIRAGQPKKAKEPDEITEELDEAEKKLDYAIQNFDKLPIEETSKILKEAETIANSYYTESYNPLYDQIQALKARVNKVKRTSIKATNKEDRDRVLYELRTRLNRAIQESDNISVENLKSTLTWAQETYEGYFDPGTDNYSEESKLLKQLRNTLMQKQRLVPVNKETAARELFELRSRISRALENPNLNRPQLTGLLTWAKQIHEKYYSYGFMGSEELDLIERLEKQLAQQGTQVVGIFGNIKSLWQNNAEFNKINKEAKRLSSNIRVSGEENASNINENYNALMAQLNKFSTDSKGTFDKKVEKLRTQLRDEVFLFRQKNSLQRLINELTAFVNSIGRGDIPLIQAKKTYAEARKKYAEFESSSNRDLLKQGLDISYDLIKTVYDYVTELSTLNLVVHEIERVRSQLRKKILTLGEAQREREKLMPKLESMAPKFKLTQIKRNVLLGELRSGY